MSDTKSVTGSDLNISVGNRDFISKETTMDTTRVVHTQILEVEKGNLDPTTFNEEDTQ